ncbi:MAG: GspE/PulE family protein [Bacillota bacterium]
MGRFNRRRVSEALFKAASINSDQVESILTEQQRTGKPVSKILLDRGALTEEVILKVMEKQLGIPRVDLYNKKIGYSAIDCIPFELAKKYKVMPLAIRENQLVLAMADPLDLAVVDEVEMISEREVYPVLASEGAIENAFEQYYALKEYPAVERTGRNLAVHEAVKEKEEDTLLSETANKSPVVKMVYSLIGAAIEKGASDIHLEPTGEGLRVRLRLDGILHDFARPKQTRPEQVISRVKIMASLDIAEKRLPQDGNIQLQHQGGEINLRVSTMPTIYGEKVVIRLLDKEKIVLPLEKLGFAANNYHTLQNLLLNQSGMILLTGPTGCGKTTTLYSALNYLNREAVNLITVEDPVECRLQGINQIQVNRRIGRTFAGALRSILRQDPDIIMVGEIRDLETAKIATQAALTGHLVLSTLHTNNAAGAVTRLVDMGLEPFMVTASLSGVIAQRLIRKNCSKCSEEYKLSDEEKVFFSNFFKEDPPDRLRRGSRCKYCHQTGFRGRTSIQELLTLNQELQSMILRRAKAADLQEKALDLGMISLARDGLRCLLSGETSMGEVVRATYSNLYDPDFSNHSGSNNLIARLHRGEG